MRNIYRYQNYLLTIPNCQKTGRTIFQAQTKRRNFERLSESQKACQDLYMQRGVIEISNATDAHASEVEQIIRHTGTRPHIKHIVRWYGYSSVVDTIELPECILRHFVIRHT